MKTYFAIALGAAVALSGPQSKAGTQSARNAARDAADRVCVYKDAEFKGWEQCYGVGDENHSLGGKKDEISSIRVFGRARVFVYDKTDFRGQMTDFVANVPDLGIEAGSGGRTWNDRIESLRVNLDFSSGSYGRDVYRTGESGLTGSE